MILDKLFVTYRIITDENLKESGWIQGTSFESFLFTEHIYEAVRELCKMTKAVQRLYVLTLGLKLTNNIGELEKQEVIDSMNTPLLKLNQLPTSFLKKWNN